MEIWAFIIYLNYESSVFKVIRAYYKMSKITTILVILWATQISCEQEKFAGPDSLLLINAKIIDGSGSKGKTGKSKRVWARKMVMAMATSQSR